VSAASLNYNAVTLRVQPAATAGAPARVLAIPTSDEVTIHNQAVTVSEGETNVDARVTHGATTEITVFGRIRVEDHAGAELRKRIDHPSRFLGSAFRAILGEVGITVAGGVRLGLTPATARPLATHESEPLSWVVRELEKYSNNFMAETVLKTMGAESAGTPGTWAAGVAAVRGYLDGIGVAAGSYRYENGSGLYDSNRFTPDQVVRILRAAALDFRTGADFVAALAVAGADGTLAHRMHGSPAERYVRAKSGTLNGTSALSGFAGGDGRPTLVFAVLVNDLPTHAEAVRAARELEDGVAELLVRYLETK
jgi:D-alanyl-D-alanine carboxypeptidase/D-alanyl-D-alanine-endopeptidase (penicillin-binding protein 4)